MSTGAYPWLKQFAFSIFPAAVHVQEALCIFRAPPGIYLSAVVFLFFDAGAFDFFIFSIMFVAGKDPKMFDLYIEYQGKRLHYKAEMFHRSDKTEFWTIRGKNQALTFWYNMINKTARQEMGFGARKVTDEFRELLEREFQLR
jgi:hypothetical protein